MAEFLTINSGRARVIVTVDDQSFVNLITEDSNTHLSAYIPTNTNIVNLLGNTAERDQGYLEVSNLDNWHKRLRDSTFGISGSAGLTYANPEDEKADVAGRGLSADWYSVQNYLLYGGQAIVGFTAANFANELIDSVFCTDLSVDRRNTTLAVPSSRGGDCVAIVPAGGSGDGVALADLGQQTYSPTVGDSQFAENKIAVYGFKKHLGYQRNSAIETDSQLIKTSCAADAAGCLARTDSTFRPFFSPAGFTRGRILDVVRLAHNPTETEQDTLFDDAVNPVVTFPGEGTFLFGDKTHKSTTSTLSRINVSRLFILLKRDIGRIAKSLLFEQNDADTRRTFLNRATRILEGIRADRGVFDYRVVCDESNNPAERIDANIFVADVFVKPTKSINFLQLTFTNKNQDAELS
tara:strand:+ start:436 stop:1659 length:1224 start_codon:yes stop_codon:yes gene_type:complete